MTEGGAVVRYVIDVRRWLVCSMAIAVWSCPAFPIKPVRYVVPFGAGASPDIVARLLADRLTRLWGQQVIVENRVGVAGTLGTAFVAKSPQLSMELRKLLVKIDVAHIPYKIAAQGITDTIGGQIPFNISNLPAILSPVQAGRLRALAVTGAKRAALLPAVPTMQESGVLRYEVNSWYGVCAPANTPAPVLDKLYKDFTTVLRLPDVQQRLDELAIDTAPKTPEEFDQFIRAEIVRWAKVIKDAGIPPQ
jgi:tripartite-type tricarboxylate transporter receptor subunit TctC